MRSSLHSLLRNVCLGGQEEGYRQNCRFINNSRFTELKEQDHLEIILTELIDCQTSHLLNLCIKENSCRETSHSVNMKTSLVVVAAVLAVFASGMEAAPMEEASQKSSFDFGVFAPAIADHGARQKRVTCDILSVSTPWGSLGHAACAGHCLVLNKGFRGGYCDNHGVCNCRY